MSGSSNALDVSAPTQDLKFMLTSNVNVSNLVSVKLSGHMNYKIWKAQMLCLIKSQALLHIIDHAENRFGGDDMIPQYDQLVKGWIFGTMMDHMLNNYADFDSAREVWMKLESRFGLQKLEAEGIALDVSVRAEDLKFMVASSVNVSNFVSVKLCGYSNYDVWKTQMLCLLESHDLLHIIHAEIPLIDAMTKSYNKLVRGWIFGSVSDKVLKAFKNNLSAKILWNKLSIFTNPPYTTDTDGDSCDALDVFACKEELKYMQASNVNVSNFVTVKLSGRDNYHIWWYQMHYLIESQGLIEITKDGIKDGFKITKNYHNLVNGWIFSTMTDQVLQNYFIYDYHTDVKSILQDLESKFADESPTYYCHGEVEFVVGKEALIDVQEMENTDRNRLYEAAIDGCWWKAKSILKIHKNAATEAITTNGNTILHIAVEMGHNYFVEKLLEFLKDGEAIEKKNLKGRTALHVAVAVSNADAAQLLVQKRKELLLILDSYQKSALDIALEDSKLDTSVFLLKSATPSDSSTYSEKNQENSLHTAILAKNYDLAEALLTKFPDVAARNGDVLTSLIITFPSDFGFKESFIYPAFNNVYQKTVERGSLLFDSNFLDKCVDDILRVVKICNYTCCKWLGKNSMILLVLVATLYPIYQLICLLILLLHLTFSMLYFLLWKFLTVTVHPIKNIEKKKKEYGKAKKILSLICDQMGTLNDIYCIPLFEAVLQDNYVVVDEILFKSPTAIGFNDNEGINIIQHAIINRSEKVYNLIYHIIQRRLRYEDILDSSENNLVHLVARLAPSFVLNRTTGAALQLQRELFWYEEVKKLKSPLDLMDKNTFYETPSMLFTKEHKDLMKEGENWIKATAESCSITAALIVTVVFAAAITVPGGNHQESGIPLFNNKNAFTIFAISNAFSLFTSATSLLLFLSILTARFSEKDFKVSLPRRLIFGLLTLFLSTSAMIVAFGAILFLVFCDQRPWMLAPICGFACLPISVIVTIKLPLLVDLILSTYFPIFGERSYLASCKINRKNTIFKY